MTLENFKKFLLQHLQEYQALLNDTTIKLLYDRFFAKLTPSANPTMIALGGSPGAGKTTFLKTQLVGELNNNAHHHDIDEVLVLLPNYQELCKKESALKAFETCWPIAQKITDVMLLFAMQHKLNIICDRTHGSEQTYLNLKKANDQGYCITFYGFSIEEEKAIKNVRQRAEKEGRVVTEAITREYLRRFSTLWPCYLNIANKIVLLDNSEFSYKEIFRKENDKEDTLDFNRYQRFLSFSYDLKTAQEKFPNVPEIFANYQKKKLILSATIEAQPGKAHALKEALTVLAAASRKEEGCLIYTVNQSQDHPEKFMLYEEWADQTAFKKHITMSYVLEWHTKKDELAKPYEPTFWNEIVEQSPTLLDNNAEKRKERTNDDVDNTQVKKQKTSETSHLKSNSDVKTWGRFQWSAEQYKNNSTPQEMRAYTALQNMGSLEKGIDVLDVGSGVGNITRSIAKQVFPGRVVGIDLSQSMAHKSGRDHSQVMNLEIIQDDAVYFKFTRKFDLITSFFCVQWIPEKSLSAAIKNIYSHLKEDGKTCILLPCYDFPHIVIKGLAGTEKWEKHFEKFKDQQSFLNETFYHALFQETGFSDIEIKIIESHHVMTNQQFIDYTRQWCGCYNWVEDTKLREDFVKDILKNLEKEQHNGETFDMTQKSLQIIAKKPSMDLINDTSSVNPLSSKN